MTDTGLNSMPEMPEFLDRREKPGATEVEMISPERSSWADAICSAWQSGVTSIIETGQRLIDSKAALAHGEFEAMVEDDLPFKSSTARRLMAVARDERIAKRAHVNVLPPAWGTLYELTKLPDDVFEARLADGTIHPEMKRADVARENRLITRARDVERVRDLPLATGKFRTLVIDPPWDYEWLSLAGRAAPGYATMKHEELLALPVPAWADDPCHLYLWTTNNFMTRAVDLMKAWGFQHKTVLTWVKPRWGLGSYFRNSTEHVLFGVKGDLNTRCSDVATHFEAPTAEHSAKPDIFYDIVRRASYEPFGEAFQRGARDGFSNLYAESVAA